MNGFGGKMYNEGGFFQQFICIIQSNSKKRCGSGIIGNMQDNEILNDYVIDDDCDVLNYGRLFI